METLITLGISIILVELLVMTILWVTKKKQKGQPAQPTPQQVHTVQQPSNQTVAPQNVQPTAKPTPSVRTWRPTDEQNYYDVLGIAITASEAEIKTAYKSLLKIWHPDINKERDAQEQMAYIIEAYETLSDQETREKYNAGLALQELAYQGV